MPEATLAVRRAAFHQLLSGRPATFEAVAAATRLSRDAAREAAGLVASVGMAETDGDTIVGMDGLTTRHTHHRLMVDGVWLWTWCAYDIVGIAAALEAEAIGRTDCGLCGKSIEVVIRKGEPDIGSAVGWLPDESCSNVIEQFCPSALLFCSEDHLQAWRARVHPGSGDVLDLQALAERGRRTWSQLVA